MLSVCPSTTLTSLKGTLYIIQLVYIGTPIMTDVSRLPAQGMVYFLFNLIY